MWNEIVTYWQQEGTIMTPMVSYLLENIWVTLYMTVVSTVLAYVLGLPMGIAMVVTAPGGLRSNHVVYRILDFVANIVRSVPFLDRKSTRLNSSHRN